jgi:hypothetical protein
MTNCGFWGVPQTAEQVVKHGPSPLIMNSCHFTGWDAGKNGEPCIRAWPAIDVAEKEDSVLVRAEVPGMKPEEIEISVYGNTLTISGEKKEATAGPGRRFLSLRELLRLLPARGRAADGGVAFRAL